jgi:hypothetical protein
MSEPTSGGTRKPDPDPDRDPEAGQNEAQEEAQDAVFSDPTAPVWADPTAPIPEWPTPPSASHPQDDQPTATPSGPANPQPTPPVAPPVSNPYAQQPAQPYGQQQPAQPYGQQQPPQPYGQQQPGPQYPAYGQQPYATGPHTETNGSAIVLTILSGVIMLSTCFLVGIPSLIFGIMALTSNSTDPDGSRKKAKTGWIIFAVNFGIVVLLAIVGFGLLIATGNNVSDSDNFN